MSIPQRATSGEEKRVFKEVSRGNPCPICKHAGQCGIDQNGDWVNCYRVAEGSIKSKMAKDGREYHVHRLTPFPERPPSEKWPAPKFTVADGRGELADADILDLVYSKLIEVLPLDPMHKVALSKRKFPAMLAMPRGYRSIGLGRRRAVQRLIKAGLEEHFPRVPGFITKADRDGSPCWTLAGKGGLIIPVRNPDGKVIALRVRLDEVADGEGKFRSLSSKGQGGPGPGSPVHFPLFRWEEKVPRVARLTEGAMKADIATELSGMFTIGLPGVGSWSRAAGALEAIGATTARVAFDADCCQNRAVANALRSLVADLAEKGFVVELERWNIGDGKGIDDLLAAGKQPDVITGIDTIASVVESIVADAEKADPPPKNPRSDPPTPPTPDAVHAADGRPQILIWVDEFRVNAEAIAALAQEPDIFQRAGLLVTVADSAEQISPLPPALLRERLTQCIDWVREGKDGPVPASPPQWCTNAIDVRRDWPSVRRLEAVVPHPVLLPDGTILAGNGYHEPSGIMVRLAPGLHVAVPDAPGLDDVTAAVLALEDVVHDFPFQAAAHKAAWFAGLLTPLCWFSFNGPAPMFLVDGNVRGVGKGLLADCIALIVTGRSFPVMGYTSDGAELRKSITSVALAGDRMVLLDNLAGPVGNDVLDRALTCDVWKDRVLGVSKTFEGPLHVCWYATGNNVSLRADTARRTCHIRLESPEENPELKTGFKHPRLRSYIRAERGRLLSAALTIVKAWIVYGKPMENLKPWGSYEGWSDVVRSICVFAGMDDPGETRQELQSASDTEANALTSFIHALSRMDPAGTGKTTAEIVNAIAKPATPPPDWYSALREAVEELCGKLDSRTLSARLRHFKRRNVGGRMIDQRGTAHGGAIRWHVCSVKSWEPGF